MKIDYTTEIEVTPFIISDASTTNARRIGGIIESFEGINLFRYRVVEGKLLILVSGRIGNRLQSLIEKIGAHTCSDDAATKIINAKKGLEYLELDDDLIDIFQ